jgi:hypothetical protein
LPVVPAVSFQRAPADGICLIFAGHDDLSWPDRSRRARAAHSSDGTSLYLFAHIRLLWVLTGCSLVAVWVFVRIVRSFLLFEMYVDHTSTPQS